MGSPYFISICPWILLQRIRKDIIYLKWANDISQFVRDALLQGYYVSLMVDQFYIPASSAFNKKHRNHELFIYGFDDTTEIFLISDNFQNGKYTKGSCSFTDLNNSYIDLSKTTDLGQELVYLLSFNKYGKFEINIEVLKELLSDYLCSVNSSQKNNLLNQPLKKDWIYGLRCYDHIVTYLNNVKTTENYLDVRPFYVQKNHKSMMIKRLLYLSEIGILNDDENYITQYINIEKISAIVVNLTLKYNITKDKNILNRIAENLGKMSRGESEILPKILKSL
ncbi:hypothetical protein [Paenibacillus lautus]|uniref:hypothetical protein n=1 Tax=Paenibacillus lautus TaxID=1401 RepID=UPI003D2E4252